MNSDPNSDSEQCTESKLGRVHSAHTHGPGCEHAACALHPGRSHSGCWAPCCDARWAPCRSARWAPCRGARWALSWPPARPCHSCALPCRCAHARTGSPCCSPPLSRYKFVSRDRIHAARCRTYRSAPALCLRALSGVSQPLASCVATPGVPLLSRYKELYRDTLR